MFRGTVNGRLATTASDGDGDDVGTAKRRPDVGSATIVIAKDVLGVPSKEWRKNAGSIVTVLKGM